MKKNIIISIFLCSGMLFFSCEKSIVFNVDTQENKLVVNSFISANSDAFANVSLSLDPLENSFPDMLTDAVIHLYKNGAYITDYIFDPSLQIYIADSSAIHAAAGDEFSIIATAPGKDTVTAETKMPAAVDITDIQIVDTVLLESGYYYDSLGVPIFGDSIPYYKIEIHFTDTEGDDKYSLTAEYADDYGSTPACFTTNDPVYAIGDEFEFGNSEKFITICDDTYFDDLSFKSGQKTLTIYLLQISSDFFPNPKYIITLQHLSPEYYKYISSESLQSSTNGNPFAQPVSVFSNIQGGFGIFAAFNESVAEIEL